MVRRDSARSRRASRLHGVRGNPIILAVATSKPKKRAPMTAAHKAALARGREEGRVVRRYLEAIEHHRPRRGPKRTPESVKRRLVAVSKRLDSAAPLTRLHLIQEQADLRAELERMGSDDDRAALEKAFVKVVRSYSRRKGIGYHAWRASGVSAAVLQRAGITRATGADGA